MSKTQMRTGAERTLALLEEQVGRSVEDVETPVVIVDLDRLEANLGEVQSYADQHGIAVWPHTKTHKSPEIGLMQLQYGAAGLTVAKTGEAEVFHEAGARSLLIHYPPFGQAKWDRLAALVVDGSELSVAMDSSAPAEGLSDALSRRGVKANVFVELDLGLHRTGQTTVEGAVALGQELDAYPGLELVGISGYPGHCRGDEETIRSRLAASDAFLRETRDAFGAAGLRCDRISGGSTPTRFMTHETCVNELRSGTYALLDRTDGDQETAALRVVVTVISDSVPDQVVVDAGSKTFTSDDHPDGGHGIVVGWPGLELETLNEEHGYVRVVSSDSPAIGARPEIVPNHACGCVNLHDGLLAVRNGVVDHVVNVAARGLVR
jgi:D-serine deaminase-like pyridoxal phosphate-dependent protein